MTTADESWTAANDSPIMRVEAPTTADDPSSTSKCVDKLTDGVCLFCNIRRKRKRNQEVPCHKSSDETLINSIVMAANGLHDIEMFEKMNSIEKDSYFYYHFPCKQEYLKRFVRPVSAGQRTEWHDMRDLHEQTFEKICEYVEINVIEERKCYSLGVLKDNYLSILTDLSAKNNIDFDKNFTPQHLSLIHI